LHTGAAQERDEDYFGPPVNRVARLLSAAHGGQVLLSLPTQELVRDQLLVGTTLRDLESIALKISFVQRGCISSQLLICLLSSHP
jgi:class 3 adenylate cyclase